jgi:hypothetical protein
MFPPDFPDEFIKGAFISGAEAAWPPDSLVNVVRWFQKNGIAVLGTELWLVHEGAIYPGVFVDGMRNIYGTDVSPKPKEEWGSYVTRSADETLCYFETLRLPPEAKEQGDVFINVVWSSESDFQNLRVPE